MRVRDRVSRASRRVTVRVIDQFPGYALLAPVSILTDDRVTLSSTGITDRTIRTTLERHSIRPLHAAHPTRDDDGTPTHQPLATLSHERVVQIMQTEADSAADLSRADPPPAPLVLRLGMTVTAEFGRWGELTGTVTARRGRMVRLEDPSWFVPVWADVARVRIA